MPTAVDYDTLEVIGQGSFGNIRKVRRKVDGIVMARKEIKYDKMEAKERDQLTAEFSILSALRHPNIVEYHHREHIKELRMVYIYMEYCGGGDLACLLKDLRKKGTPLREDAIWLIFVQLVSALYRCHYGVDPPEHPPGTRNQAPPAHLRGNTVIHRDLKPENVFLDEDHFVKLGDFGLSKMLGSEHQLAMTYVGTPLYMSPELVSDTPYNLKTDIWSLGCIMYELCTLKPPFTAKSHHHLFHMIKQGKFEPIPNIYSHELRGAIEHCLRCDPKERPETSQLLFMPAMQNFREKREMVLIRKQLQAKENQLNAREALLAAKEREIGTVESRLIAKNNGLLAKERELMAKEQELIAKEREMKHYLQEKSHSLREQIDMEVREEWRIKAEVEVRQQIEQRKMDLQSHFEFEVNQRVGAQVMPRLEAEFERRVAELNLVPAHVLLSSTHSSSASSSNLSAETSITSVSSFFSPPNSFSHPELNDVDMASPSRDTPVKGSHLHNEKPPVLDLRHSVLHKALLEKERDVSTAYRYSDPHPLGNISMDDLFEEPEHDVDDSPRAQDGNSFSRVSLTGSPFPPKRSSLRRSQTSTGVNLFPSSKRSSLGHTSFHDDLDMVKTAVVSDSDKREVHSRALGLVELAKQREQERKRGEREEQELRSSVAVWDPEKDDMPSPFLVRTRDISLNR